jgi:hypothetical protein
MASEGKGKTAVHCLGYRQQGVEKCDEDSGVQGTHTRPVRSGEASQPIPAAVGSGASSQVGNETASSLRVAAVSAMIFGHS